MIFRVSIILLALYSSLFALSQGQIKTIQKVRDIAKTIPDKRGETFENTLSAICLTESSAGKNMIGDFKQGVHITKASLGAMQIQVATVKFMADTYKNLRWIKELSDSKIANTLITDLEFSATIAAHYIKWLSNHRSSYFTTVSGYNGGYYNKPYYYRVMKNMEIVKKYKKNGQLH